MFENPKRGRRARNFTTNVPNVSRSQIVFRSLPNTYFPKIDVGCPLYVSSVVLCVSEDAVALQAPIILVTRELIYHLMTHYHHDGLLPGEDGE